MSHLSPDIGTSKQCNNLRVAMNNFKHLLALKVENILTCMFLLVEVPSPSSLLYLHDLV